MWSWSAITRCVTIIIPAPSRAVPQAARCASLHLSTLRPDSASPRFTSDYERVELLEKVNAQTQQVFSLDMASRKERHKAAVADTIKELQNRPGDTGSTTVQKHMQKHRKDYSTLRSLVQLVHRRRKLLLYLKRANFQNYLKTIADFNLRHPVNEKYPKKSVSHQNRIAERQKKAKSRPFLKK